MLLCAGLGVSACVLNPDRLPRTYLLQARQAVRAHDAPAALAALNQAESLWLNGNRPSSAPFGFDPEALRDMGRARQSVQMGRWGDAEYYVRTAIAQPTVIVPG